ncbi:hypothetical protein [Streptomyces sp. SAJ15]|uniref:hypothetical protein n=1 Tax=Streptomyces sp. SAJ15 TaxID=2011095 RepID=UPI00118505BE|nr:hypothetical protein [Streptomyces sp. SAJ15]TVL93150.1 hypothetical protein CD790_08525 [Streptomyces sp. SAJ15]
MHRTHRPTDEPVPTPHPDHTDPAVLGALLARHGWRRRGGAPGRYARWTPPGPLGAGTSLLVPESREFPDSGDLLAEALTALSRSAAPSAREVLTGLAVPSDEIRWWREAPESGRLPGSVGAWAAQEQLRAGARATLLAGALATHDRVGYHGARHRREAADWLARVLVGPVGPGGRELTAFVPVADGRTTTAALLRALYAARDATDYQRATGGTEAFEAAVAAGVSRELTEALVTLVRGAEGARIAVEWSPAAGPPEGFAARPEPVEFSPGDLPGLREAGARYLRGESSVPVRVTGVVLRLRRDAPDGPGTVRLRVLAGADVARLRVALGADDYRIAGHAHLVGLPIRVSGRLESRGGFRRLTGASGVAPVQVDEAERDRLLKSLQENLDFFEEACGDAEGFAP